MSSRIVTSRGGAGSTAGFAATGKSLTGSSLACPGRRSDGTQSAFRFQPLEDLRQSAPESGATSDHSPPPGRLVFHACSDPVERDHRGSDVVAGSKCFPRPIVPSAAARNEILARPARPSPARHRSRLFFWRIMRHGARCHCSRRSTGE